MASEHSNVDEIAHYKAALSAVFEQAVELHENPHPLLPYRDALGYRLGTTGHAYDVINTTEAIQKMDRLQADLHRLMDAAQNVWAWVGPGYPDLDDLDERDRFMRDVSKLAAVYFSLQRSQLASDEGRS